MKEQLADPTSIQSLSYVSQAVEAINLESAEEQFTVAFFCVALFVLFIVFSVLFMFAPLM